MFVYLHRDIVVRLLLALYHGDSFYDGLGLTELDVTELTTALSSVTYAPSTTYDQFIFTGSQNMLLRIHEAVTITTSNLVTENFYNDMATEAAALLSEPIFIPLL